MKRAVLVAGLMLSLPADPVLAQEDDYPPEVLGLTVSDATLSCPAPTTVSGTGFPPGSEVVISVDDEELTALATDGDGTFATTVEIAGGVGRHTITAFSSSAGGETVTAVVTCVAGEEAAGVAFTGTNITVGLVILVGLLVAGGAALVAGRRRAGTSA